MKRIAYFLPLLLIILSACTSTDGSTPAIESVSEEETAINQAVRNAYAALGFAAGDTPDYDAIRRLFTPNATMYHFRYDTLAAFDLDGFVQGYKAAVDGGSIQSFSEVELGGKTEYFGKVAHRISAYGSYFNGSDEMLERGVNSFQLLKLDGQWIINSVIWDIEKDGQPIPDKFLDSE